MIDPGARAGAATGLPRLLVVADAETAGARLPDRVAAAVHHGARAVLLRARGLSPPARMALAGRLRAQLEPVGGLLVVAGGPGDAVHLARAEPVPEPRPAVLGRSCHDAAEVDRAVGDACTYVTVSPVYPTDSKPGYGPALGPTGLAALCRPGLPVYALGGVRPATVSACLAAGAYGVAVMGPLHHRPDLVPAYLERLPP